MKRLIFILAISLLLTHPATAETKDSSANFQAEIVKINSQESLDLKILSVTDNDFQLAAKDFIQVNLKDQTTSLQTEDLINGTIYHWQAEVNNETIDWYMIKDYTLIYRPKLKAQEKKLISYAAALAAVLSMLLAEKIIQKAKASIV